jgi:hypothetical protein
MRLFQQNRCKADEYEIRMTGLNGAEAVCPIGQFLSDQIEAATTHALASPCSPVNQYIETSMRILSMHYGWHAKLNNGAT